MPETLPCTWHHPDPLPLAHVVGLVARGYKKRICPECGYTFFAERWRNSIHTKPPVKWDDAKEVESEQ